VGETYNLSGTGGDSENPVTFSSLTPATCSVSDGLVEFLAAGSCTVAADQAGNANYFDAPQVTQSMNITELNLAPVINGIMLPGGPIAIGTSLSIAADFTDGNLLDVHTATVEWDDGVTSAGSISEDLGGGTVSDNHTYTGAGVYTVDIVVSDGSLTGSRSSELDVPAYVVVYDPSAGFVTGGGWITSPAGAYPDGPTLTGKASFGFVSRYKKGATTPSGNTEFHFNAATFEFSSASYQWLVVAGARAQFKGEGTINGAGNYGFLLSAVDGQVSGGGGTDRFRIKIWDIATGSVIYDNQIGAADDETASAAVGGGSIVIHP
jgi:PKD repeat protein